MFRTFISEGIGTGYWCSRDSGNDLQERIKKKKEKKKKKEENNKKKKKREKKVLD